MITNKHQGQSQASTSTATARSAKSQTKALSHEAIAEKAYEIWLSQGQPFGCEQKNWLEAEVQLKQG